MRRRFIERLRPGTWKGWVAYGFVALLIFGAVAGESEDQQDGGRPTADSEQREAAAPKLPATAADREERRALRRERQRLRREQARLRRERLQVRRERARARKARAAARREREQEQQLETPAPPPTSEPEPEVSCHPSYDPCLDPNATDYDCDGGSGDGPMYTGFVTIKGPDDYDLDSDGDGTGCES
jgi:hypothetical protein